MNRIDVHHHLFPPAFVASLVENDHYLSKGVAARWTPELSLADMDAGGGWRRRTRPLPPLVLLS
jgi:hypothetical protein